MSEFPSSGVEELTQLLHSLFETTERLPAGPERVSAFRKVDDFRERITRIIRRSEIRVLIVEDEFFVANDLEQALKIRGATVIGPCSDFADGYLNAARDCLDVAILDINLRDRSAYPIADELMRQRIPFVFCTGYSANVIPKRFSEVEVWQKPFDTAALVEHITQLCQASSDRRCGPVAG